MAGINIPFLSNVRDFLRGTGDVENALDDVASGLDDMASEAEDAARTSARSLDDVTDALDDVGRDSQDAGRDLARGLEDGADSGTDAAQRLERSFRDSLDRVRTEASDTGAAVARDMDDGTTRASEGMTQLGEEGAANAREVAASFDGSAESIADGFQGLAAEALGGFGPAGAVAGVAVAAGMGMAMAATERAKEEAQETAEAIAEIAGAMIDLGDTTRGPEQVRDALKDAAGEAEDGTITLQKWSETVNDAGLDFSDYAGGMAGDAEAAARSLTEITDEVERLRAETIAATEGGTKIDSGLAVRNETIASLEEARAGLEEVAEQTAGSAEVFDLYTEAVEGTSAAQVEAAETAAAAAEAVRDKAAAALEASNAEIGYAATVADTTETIAENGATTDLATEAGRANMSALNELAAQTLALADATKDNGRATEESNAKTMIGRDAFVAAAMAAGQTEQAAHDLADQYGLIPETVTTDANLTGVDTAKTELDALVAPRSVPINPSLSKTTWQSQIDTFASGLRAPTIPATVRLGQTAV